MRNVDVESESVGFYWDRASICYGSGMLCPWATIATLRDGEYGLDKSFAVGASGVVCLGQAIGPLWFRRALTECHDRHALRWRDWSRQRYRCWCPG